MENRQIIPITWDAAVPSGVSQVEHMRGLAVRMIEAYFIPGGKGVILAHPMTISILSVSHPGIFGVDFKWDGPTDHPIESGRIGGIPVWASMDVPANEVLIVEDPDDLQPLAKIEITNFVEVPPVLDRMAQIR